MSKIKIKNNKIKLKLLTIVLIAFIPMLIALNAIATEFEMQNEINVEDNVGIVVATYQAKHTVSQADFEKYFGYNITGNVWTDGRPIPYTALTENKAIYCLWHGKKLFNQHPYRGDEAPYANDCRLYNDNRQVINRYG